MKRNLFFAGILGMALVFGLVFTGCDTGSTGNGRGTTKFEGVWQHQHPNAAHATYTFTNEKVTYHRDDFEPVSGVFTYDDTTLNIQFENGDDITYQYTLSGGVLNLEGNNGQYYYGNFVKQ